MLKLVVSLPYVTANKIGIVNVGFVVLEVVWIESLNNMLIPLLIFSIVFTYVLVDVAVIVKSEYENGKNVILSDNVILFERAELSIVIKSLIVGVNVVNVKLSEASFDLLRLSSLNEEAGILIK